MSGLEKMKSRILEEAEQSAQEILAKAQADAEAAVTAAEGRARAEAEKIRERQGVTPGSTQNARLPRLICAGSRHSSRPGRK